MKTVDDTRVNIPFDAWRVVAHYMELLASGIQVDDILWRDKHELPGDIDRLIGERDRLRERRDWARWYLRDYKGGMWTQEAQKCIDSLPILLRQYDNAIRRLKRRGAGKEAAKDDTGRD